MSTCRGQASRGQENPIITPECKSRLEFLGEPPNQEEPIITPECKTRLEFLGEPPTQAPQFVSTQQDVGLQPVTRTDLDTCRSHNNLPLTSEALPPLQSGSPLRKREEGQAPTTETSSNSINQTTCEEITNTQPTTMDLTTLPDIPEKPQTIDQENKPDSTKVTLSLPNISIPPRTTKPTVMDEQGSKSAADQTTHPKKLTWEIDNQNSKENLITGDDTIETPWSTTGSRNRLVDTTPLQPEPETTTGIQQQQMITTQENHSMEQNTPIQPDVGPHSNYRTATDCGSNPPEMEIPAEPPDTTKHGKQARPANTAPFIDHQGIIPHGAIIIMDSDKISGTTWTTRTLNIHTKPRPTARFHSPNLGWEPWLHTLYMDPDRFTSDLRFATPSTTIPTRSKNSWMDAYLSNLKTRSESKERRNILLKSLLLRTNNLGEVVSTIARAPYLTDPLLHYSHPVCI